MDTIKKLFIYFLLFLALFVFVGFMVNVAFKKNEGKYLSNYTINIDSPKVVVTNSRVLYDGGKIEGYIFNDTKEHIRDKILQFNFYDVNNKYLGNEIKEIKYFNVEEKIKFDVSYNFKKVDRIEILYLDEKVEMENSNNSKIADILNTDSNTLKIAAPIAAVLTLLMVIP